MSDTPFTYQLLDTGNGCKLEQVGPFRLNRPATQAVWPMTLPRQEWQEADATYTRDSSGSGKWAYKNSRLPDAWEVEFHGLKFEIKPTAFGHLGIFPEHRIIWQRLEALSLDPDTEILNLFAYTGGGTLSAARAGYRVCHLDASKGAVNWAKKNAELSGLSEKPVRWIVDDVTKFLQREVRRGRQYDGLIIDPPSYGRGAKGEVFKIERDISELLDLTRKVLKPVPRFIGLSCHSPGFTPIVLSNLLESMTMGNKGVIQSGEMFIQDDQAKKLPLGAWSAWGD
ncbi:MAG: class I SAM-dependent methyltransferase [Planctomycetota bacterium]|nr:class I SAM-dependent methyltransferase [Planctomycetota bacterium]